MIDVDMVLAEDRKLPPDERSFPWEESRGGVTVVVEPQPHHVADMRAWREKSRDYCHYVDWCANGSRARFYHHVELTGDMVMMRARAEIAREIAAGLYEKLRKGRGR
jgi:hypothetical protein